MEELNLKITQLESEISNLRNELQAHTHDGVMSQQVQIDDVAGFITTVSSATELANRIAGKPLSVIGQMFIDTSTATKRLYIYDAAGNVWYSVTIA